MVARMVSDLDPDLDTDIDPEAKRIVEMLGVEAVNNAAIHAELDVNRLLAAGDKKGAARARRAADGLEEMLQAAGVPRHPGH